MARRTWFLEAGASIALACLALSLLGSVLVLIALYACLPSPSPCGALFDRLAAVTLGASFLLLFVGWGTLHDLLLITQTRRARAASWLAGLPDPRATIPPAWLVTILVGAGAAGLVGSFVNGGLALVFAAESLLFGLSLVLTLRAAEIRAERRRAAARAPQAPPMPSLPAAAPPSYLPAPSSIPLGGPVAEPARPREEP